MIEEGLDSRVSHYMLITIVIPQSRPVCYKIQSRGRDPRFQSDGHPASREFKGSQPLHRVTGFLASCRRYTSSFTIWVIFGVRWVGRCPRAAEEQFT